MKHAKVQLNYYPDKREAEFMLIENETDLQDYTELQLAAVREKTKECIKSPLFPSKVDHMLGKRDLGTSLLAAGYIKASSHGLTHPKPSMLNNPMIQMGIAADNKLEKFSQALASGKRILVGNTGGYQFVWDETEILGVYDKQADNGAPKDRLVFGSRVIVLENDWSLPNETVELLKNRDISSYSVIYDLRSHTHEQLLSALKQFRTDGGTSVFVYTTGLDVGQMYSYTDTMLGARLSKIEFVFNGPVSLDVEAFLHDRKNVLDITVDGKPYAKTRGTCPA
jgi:hypothetical protein